MASLILWSKSPHFLQPTHTPLQPLPTISLPPPRPLSDAQAAIRRMASEEPGPGQQHALQARKHIAMLRKARPGIIIEIRWCLAHKGVAGNEKADEWVKIAGKEPDARGVEWLNYSGQNEARTMPLPRSLAYLKREISEKK